MMRHFEHACCCYSDQEMWVSTISFRLVLMLVFTLLQPPAAIQAELHHTTQKLDGTNEDDDQSLSTEGLDG